MELSERGLARLLEFRAFEQRHRAVSVRLQLGQQFPGRRKVAPLDQRIVKRHRILRFEGIHQFQNRWPIRLELRGWRPGVGCGLAARARQGFLS
jgi:hypothetical protein